VEADVSQLLYMSYGATAALSDMKQICDGAVARAPISDMLNLAMSVCYDIHVVQNLIDRVRLTTHELVEMAGNLPSQPIA
jgi:hypothetical protein